MSETTPNIDGGGSDLGSSCWPNMADWVHNDPTGTVENIYRRNVETLRTMGGAAAPLDVESHSRMEQYLDQRMHPNPEITVAREPVMITHEEWVSRKTWPRFNGWFAPFSPRVAAVVMLGSAAVLNLGGNADNLRSLGANIWHALSPRAPIVITHEVPGLLQTTTTTFDADIDTTMAQDKISVDPTDVSSVVDRLQDALDSDGSVYISGKVSGEASDELRGDETDSTLAAPDFYNQELAAARAEVVAAAVEAEAAERGLPSLNLTPESNTEHILTDEQKNWLEAAALEAGYASGVDAINAVADGAEISGELGEFIAEHFTDTRGATVKFDITTIATTPGDATTVTEEIPNPWPSEPYDVRFLWFAPWPVIPKIKRGIKQVKKTIKETVSKVTVGISEWMRIYKEGIETAPDEDGIERTYLREYPWQWTRKFQHLLRDDRIEQILRGDYEDSEGKKQTLRVMFVDHEPTPETVKEFEKMLTNASLVQGGKLAGRISAIFVYPSDSAGRDGEPGNSFSPAEPHKNPKQIALGIDTQRLANTLGTTTPMLELIEMHMPTNPTQEELTGFNSAMHTLAHELVGHASDIKDGRIILDWVIGQGVTPSLGRLAARSAWADRGQGVLSGYPDLDDNERLIVFHDGRLASHLPTRYSGAGTPEAYAESAAAVSTGMEIPLSEVSAELANGHEGPMPDGYRVAEPIEQMVQDELGAERAPFELRFTAEPNIKFTLTDVESDPLLGTEYDPRDFVTDAGLAERARWREVPDPADMYEVRTSVTQ